MSIFRTLSVDRKVTAVIMLTSMVALLVACAGFVLFDVVSYRGKLVEELSVLAEVVGIHSAAAVAFEDIDAAAETLESLRVEPRVIGAWLSRGDGSVLASYPDRQAPLPTPLSSSLTSGQEHRFTREGLLLRRPVILDGEPIGGLVLVSSLAELHARVFRYGLISLGVLASAGLVALGMTARLRRWITDPVGHLVGVARRVSDHQDFAVRAVKQGDDELGLLVDVFNDMLAKIEQREAQLIHDAFHDALTGLPNRLHFSDRLGHALDVARRKPDEMFSVLYLDIDRFKVVNDSLGHVAGDELLVELGQRLRDSLRPSDSVARLGGDEFGVLLEGIAEPAAAIRSVERLQREIGRPFELAGQRIHAMASIGVVVGDVHYRRPEDLLRDADIAMYRAKRDDRAAYAVFDQEMHATAVRLMEIETDLRGALEREELTLRFQPIVSLREGRLTGFEALLRWQHPRRGLVGPDEFLEVAEDSGLILPIDQWVAGTACRQLLAWRQELGGDELAINLNLSRPHLARPELLSELGRILASSGVECRCVRLEVTENVLMSDPDASAALLGRLRDWGYVICVDDFGTGYSSLSRLQRFPIDVLKIDRSFVDGMSTEQGDLEIVRSIIGLAHNLGLEVIAEGVENHDQLAQLRALDCEHAQGFFFAAPLTAEDALELLRDDPRW